MLRIALALLVLAGVAHANGRAPQTIGIYPKPGAPNTLYLATTFGLLETTDEGCTFRWICEQNIGYSGTWDPTYAIGSDGTLFATTTEGLRVSRDGGCSFDTPTSELAMDDPNRIAGLWIDALDIGPTGELWVGTAATAHTNDVYVSHDNGVTFTPRGMISPEIWWKSVKVAPSNPALVYITGYQVAGTPAAYAYRTTNGGMQWNPLTLTGVTLAQIPVLRIKTVDATNPDIVFMVSENSNTPAGDRLYRSDNGGTSWTEVLATAESIHDVVFLDGQHLLVATQQRSSSAITGGQTYESNNGGLSFAPLAGAPKLACIAKRADGTLFGCGANWDPDFKAFAKSTNNGASWDKVWRFVEMAGAVQCAEGTVQHDTCEAALWDCPSCDTDLKRQFGAKGPACGANGADPAVPPKSGGGCCDAGAGAEVSLLWVLVVGAWLSRRRA